MLRLGTAGTRTRSAKVRARPFAALPDGRGMNTCDTELPWMIVFARGLRGGIFVGWIPVLARAASKEPVNCPARPRARNRNSAAWSPRSISRFRICCTVHGPSGFRGYAEDVQVAGADFYDAVGAQTRASARARRRARSGPPSCLGLWLARGEL